jgi:uncharacterized repeat protein (TIGR01451 family)
VREPDFELSADMRLLELQRGALGLPTPEKPAWERRGATDAGVPVADIADAPEASVRSAMLRAEAGAHPAEGLIPGAVVTLTLSVINDGGGDAADVIVGTPLPGGAAYRPGSFMWNGRSTYDETAESFLGAGLSIGRVGAGERATFQWKISVKLGNKPLIVAPRLKARGSAVVGATPLSLSRKASSGGAFADQVARADAALAPEAPLIPVDISVADLPIYELDEEEQIVHEAAAAALSPATPPKPVAQAQPAPPQRPEPPAAAEAAKPEVRESIVLYARIDRPTVAYFERIFDAEKPATVLQHAIFSNAIAVTLDGSGADSAALKRHLDAQAQILHRVALHEKLGKREPIAEYAGELIAQVDRLTPAAHPVPRANDALLLRAEVTGPNLSVLERLVAERERWDFVKARQFALALQAQGVDDDRVDALMRAHIEQALRAYAQTSVTFLQRLFVRLRADRTTGILFAREPSLDASARALIAALKRALP